MIRLNEKWAVGVIKEPPQWTLCHIAHHQGKELWQPKSFCQSRKALLRAIDEKVVRGADFYQNAENLAVRGDLMARLAALPDICTGDLLTQEGQENG